MQLNNIINYLNTITAITDIVWNRIFFWIPKTEQTQDYMTLNIITETQPTIAEKRNRIEFRYIAGNTTTLYSTLQTLDDELMTAMLNYKQDGVYKVVIQNLVNLYDDKQRKILLRDLFIYQT